MTVVSTSAESLPDLVWAAAERDPHAPAVDDGDRRLTYQELCEAADAAAEELCAAGAGPDAVVAIQMRAGIERVIWAVGVLRAGAAVMFVEPREPPERRAFLLEDSGARALVLDDGVRPLRDGGASDRPRERQAAYVAYTSGSTGRPKGVVTEHRAIVNYLRHVVEFCDLKPGDAQPQTASIAFDMAIHEIFATLSAGALLIVPRTPLPREAEAFAAVCEDFGITSLTLPTAVWHELGAGLRRSPEVRLPRALRVILIGGEAPQAASVEAWFAAARCEPFRIINAYGPTEAACAVSMSDMRPGAPITLGDPVANVTLRVVDDALADVAAGEEGEVVIGGHAPARGYIADPDLTARRFPVVNGEPVYRTGDRGRLGKDGRIAFLGRADRQIKVNGGFRVEPLEVQAALLRLPGVRDAHVDVTERPPLKGLVAFCVLDEGSATGEVRAALRSKLPPYMVPGRVVAVDAIPLTGRGKVDRDALLARLPAGDGGASAGGDEAVLRRAVRAAWASALGVEAEDDVPFFEAGGDSLDAMTFITALHEDTGHELDLAAFYSDPSVDGIVQALAPPELGVPNAHHVTGRTVIPLRRGGGARLWCFLPPLSGAVTRYAKMPQLLPPGDAIWACETPAALSGRGMDAVASGLAEAMIARGLSGFEDVLLSGYSLGGVFALEVARKLRERLPEDGPSVDALLLDPPPPRRALSSFEDTLDIFVRVGWRIDADHLSFLAADGRPDFDRLAEAAKAAGSLPPTGSAREMADAWSVYDANSQVLEDYTPAALPGRNAAFLRCTGVEGATAPPPRRRAPIPGAWAVVADPERSWEIDTAHFALMEPPSDVLVGAWLAEMAEVR